MCHLWREKREPDIIIRQHFWQKIINNNIINKLNYLHHALTVKLNHVTKTLKK